MSNNLLLNAAVTTTRGRIRATAAALALTMVASVVAASTPPPVVADKHPALRPEKVIPHSVAAFSVPEPATPRTDTAPVNWPAVGEATVTLDGGGGERQAGALPVRLSARGLGRPADVRVKVLPRELATDAGVSGVITTLSPVAGSLDSVSMSLDYAGFANGAANFGSRLTLVTMPSCVVDTPEKPECQVQSPLQGDNDPALKRVNATVPLAAPAIAEGATTPASYSAAGTEVVVAAVGESSGSQGTFAASSLSPSGTWSVSGNSGAFSWSYPITLPPAAADSDAAPTVSLSYSSSSVDGLTSGTNNQSAWAGLGWTYSPGFIERTSRTCAEDTALPSARKTPDLCWTEGVVTLNLSGRSTPLVLQNGTWRPQSDDGEKVELVTGAPNGARGGEHWKVTSANGVEYWFGRDSLPGGATEERTNSAWTVPVTHPTDPAHACYAATSLSLPECAHAWRWNLDYVRDPHGNATAYYYTKETNHYGANNATTGVAYTRGGWLKRIDYGMRETNGSIYGPVVPNQVEFEDAERCIPGGSVTCAPAQMTLANKDSWPDVPVDQHCASGATCNVHAPTFWTTKRLKTITTYYNPGSGKVRVDAYALDAHLDKLNEPVLLLDSITRTGYDSSGGSITLPKVSFTYQVQDNRIEGYGGMPPMRFWRLSNVRTDTGADIKVTYSNEVDPTKPACTKTNVPTDLPYNDRLCYPVYRTLAYNEDPSLDFFHKYVVTRVEVQDTTSGPGSPTQATAYKYTTVGWHYDDNELIKPTSRTYGQFRGFATVETRGGLAPDQLTLTTSTYFRGMHGDKLPTGNRTATVTNSLGESAVNDLDQYSGKVFETQTFNGDGGARLSSSIVDPITVATTATRTRSGLPDQVATITATERTRQITDLVPSGTRTVTTTKRYDSSGRVVAETTAATGLTDQCATTEYATHPTMTNRVKQTVASTGPCPPSGPQTGITAAVRTYYDGSTTLGAVPGAGDITRVETATSLDGTGQPVYQVTGSMSHDASGRTVSATDALGFTTTTTYTPPLGGIVSTIATTNPKSQTATVTLEPSRGTPLVAVDVAGRTAQARYDQLGRVVEVWQPGRAPGEEPNTKYEYLFRNDGPLAVTTRTLVDHGAGTNYLTSIDLYDSLGRPRQTQSDDVSNPSTVANRVVSDTFYDSHGRQQRSNNRYLTTGIPNTNLIGVDDGNVDDRTVISYDGAGRATVVTAYKGLNATRDTKTVYGGDRVTTIPPQGAVPTTVITDALGRTTELVQYTTAPSVNGNVVSGGTPQSTRYGYNPQGQLTKLTNVANTEWGFEYDFLGRQTARVDPDSGRSTTTYNLAGQVTSTTDALGQALSYSYDALGRKIATFNGPVGSTTTLASWVYDTAQNGVGKLHSSTRHAATGDYTLATSGYNSRGLPFDQIVTVPAGQPGLAGSYKTQFGYTSTSLPTYVTPAHTGGLPAENIQFTYDRYGQPQSTRGANMVVANSVYSSAGEPLRYALGGADQVALTFDRDTHTHRVNQITMTAVQATPQIDDVRYSHDPAGNLTKAVNRQGHPTTGPKRTECFTYDGLNRLNEAWTATDDCAAAPSTGNVGGPTPYWTTWSFNAVGSRTKQVQHQIPGGPAGDTTTDYYYSGINAPRHAVTSTATTGPAGNTGTSYGYDKSGNTISRTLPGGNQDLKWNEANQLAKVTTPAGDVTYVYDADGGQLVRTEPDKTTLFLPGQEIVRNTATGAVTGTRYYLHNGTVVAVRNTGQNPTYLKADTHGTNQVAVQSNGYAATRRTQDPYGNPLGTTEGTNTWPDNHGFLNKPTNTTTGLTEIGARNYDPTLGAFISVDPILDMGNPQSWTGYTYANNNPTTYSDPTGLFACPDRDCRGNTGPNGKNIRDWKVDALLNCGAACGDGPSEPRSELPDWLAGISEALNYLSRSSLTGTSPDPILFIVAETANQAIVEGYYCTQGNTEGCLNTALNAAPAAGGLWRAARAAINALRFAKVAKPLDDIAGAAQGGSTTAKTAGAACSFSGDTPVLMGDGTTKPIQDIKPGDTVMATDPETGEQGPREVTATLPHTDTLYQLILTDGSIITTTEDHPFWNATDKQWQRADKLDNGDHLATSDGRAVGVTGIQPNTARRDHAYNLTIHDLHTYYVVAGAHAVLVHNDGPCDEIKVVFDTLNDARDSARGSAGLGDDAIPFVQEIGPFKGRVTGMQSPDGLRGWRIDFDPKDPTKAFHVNWWVRDGRKRTAGGWQTGANVVSGGTYQDFLALISHFPGQ